MLDDDQKHVAAWTPKDGNLRVIASAGSGKTSSLVALACNLLVQDEVDASQLLLTTFTKKAGDELRTRMGQIIDRETLARVRVGTFHAIGLQTLRSIDSKQWDMKRCIDIHDGRDASIPSASALWRSICSYGKVPGSGRDSLGLPMVPDYYRKHIELWRSTGAKTYLEADTPDRLTRKEEEEFELAWDYFNEAKQRLRAWDFTDVLVAWKEYVEEQPPTRSVVLVDEAQDNNKVQLDIALALAREGGRVCVIGDSKQAIYQFRGAYPRLFNEAEHLIGAHTREIRTNYRSLPHIVQFANDFTRGKSWNHNSPALPFRIAPDGDEKVRYHLAEGPFHEADWVASEIGDRILENQNEAKDFMILTRTNAARFAFETALVARNIPNVVLGASSAFNTKEASQVLAYCVLSQFNHLDSVERILNTPKRYIPRTFVQELSREMRKVPDVLDALKSALTTSSMKPASKRGVVDLVRTLEGLRKAEWKDVPKMVERLLQPVEDEEKTDEPDEDRRSMISVVCRLAGMFPDASSLVKFAETCSQSTAAQSEKTNDNRVTISTIHKIKGCEAKVVYVSAPGDLFPHVKTTNMPEEERLYYVAITRARDDLVVTGNNAEGGLTPFFPMNE
jgi:DNA helicase-2/ATP-dependent DNA helicase PcrA